MELELKSMRSMRVAAGNSICTQPLPFSLEIPEIEVVLVEEYIARSSTDAYGIGEPANIATAPAVANAIYNAIGVRIYELPITPDKILNALNKKNAER